MVVVVMGVPTRTAPPCLARRGGVPPPPPLPPSRPTTGAPSSPRGATPPAPVPRGASPSPQMRRTFVAPSSQRAPPRRPEREELELGGGKDPLRAQLRPSGMAVSGLPLSLPLFPSSARASRWARLGASGCTPPRRAVGPPLDSSARRMGMGWMRRSSRGISFLAALALPFFLSSSHRLISSSHSHPRYHPPGARRRQVRGPGGLQGERGRPLRAPRCAE